MFTILHYSPNHLCFYRTLKKPVMWPGVQQRSREAAAHIGPTMTLCGRPFRFSHQNCRLLTPAGSCGSLLSDHRAAKILPSMTYLFIVTFEICSFLLSLMRFRAPHFRFYALRNVVRQVWHGAFNWYRSYGNCTFPTVKSPSVKGVHVSTLVVNMTGIFRQLWSIRIGA